MRSFLRLKVAVCALGVFASACAVETGEGLVAVPAPGPIAAFEGFADPATGVVEIHRISLEEAAVGLTDGSAITVGPPGERAAALTLVVEDKNGVVGTSSAANTGEFIVECRLGGLCPAPFAIPQSVVLGCGTVDSFQFDVTLRSFFPNGLASSYARISSVTNSVDATRDNTICNSDPTSFNGTDGSGVVLPSAPGLFRYGQELANPSISGGSPVQSAASARWKFRSPGGAFNFTGLIFGAPCAASGCTPAVARPEFWTAESDGRAGITVSALAEGTDLLYVGGTLRYLGPRTGSSVNVGLPGAGDAGQLINPWPTVEGGIVNALVADGTGGVFLGGTFTLIGSTSVQGLAHVNADRSVDTGFTVGVNVGGSVAALQLVGTSLVVGGNFTTLGGLARRSLGVVNTSTKAVDAAFNARVLSGDVASLAVNGTDLYLGGSFTGFTGLTQPNLARVNVATGAVDAAFAAAVDTNARVSAMQFEAATNRLFFGGTLSTVSISGVATTRRNIASVTVSPSFALDAFNGNGNGLVRAIALGSGVVFAGGDFTTMGGAAASKLAALNSTTGTAVAGFTSPAHSSTVLTLVLSGGNLLAGGAFNAGVGFVARVHALNATTGAAVSWPLAIGPNNNVAVLSSSANAIVVLGASAVVAGAFKSAGGFVRNGLGALSMIDGSATSFNPATLPANRVVNALAATPNGDLLVGSGIGASTDVRRFTAAGGAAVGFPAAGVRTNSPVLAMVVDAADVAYFGGRFNQVIIGSAISTRFGVVSVSSTGVLRSWAPAVNNNGATASNQVNSISIMNNEVYLAGDFTTLSGVAAPSLAALNRSIATGDAAVVRKSWAATGGTVLSVSGGRDGIAVAGSFTTLDGVARNRLAFVDGLVVTAFNGAADGTVSGVSLAGNTFHVTGAVTTLQGQSCGNTCTTDLNGSAFGGFNATLPGGGSTVLASGNLFAVGGTFNSVAVPGIGQRSGLVVLFAD